MNSQPVTVYLPDTHDVVISRYGFGNAKLGLGVFTYSRLPGDPHRDNPGGTCPGSTNECEGICYAKRIDGAVRTVYEGNGGDAVPSLPPGCRLLRIHVSGDFDTTAYVESWIQQLIARPDVTAWAYTRSWRRPLLLPTLERLRALPNVQLFASMDPSTPDVPPPGWRRAWIWRDVPNGPWSLEDRLMPSGVSERNMVIGDGEQGYVCPEETGHKTNCISCGYCFEGQKHDVVFLEH